MQVYQTDLIDNAFLNVVKCDKKDSFIKFNEFEKLREYELIPFGTVLPLTELKCFKYNYLKQNVTPRDAIGLATWIEKTHNTHMSFSITCAGVPILLTSCLITFNFCSSVRLKKLFIHFYY